jgi:DNA-binding NarL/FixJ family response regulator
MLLTDWNLDEAKEVWIEDGMEIERKANIKNLLDFGMQTEQIANALKLSIDMVEQYASAE